MLFGVVDFIVFVGMLVIAMAIGFFYGFQDRRKKSLDNYYFGERSMSPIPVGLSLAVTFISSVTVLGFPVYSYLYGTIMIWFSMSSIVQVFVACFYFIPLIHRLKLSSIYEYLELRFDRKLRKLASGVICILMVFYMGCTIYLTAIALSVVAPISISVSILVTATVCTLYTTLGGMKAVIWTDTVQVLVMVAGSIAVWIKTSSMVGGMSQVWESIERGQRNTVWNFDLNPMIAHTFWSVIFGQGSLWAAMTCSNQAMTQRYQSCKSVRDARIASIVSGGVMSVIVLIASMNGFVMYAFYEGCDPLQQGRIDKIDQTTALLVVEVFRDAVGMAGLFVSAAYSGMLSTVSSGINALAALLLEDFIIPLAPKMKEKRYVKLSKIISLLLGIVTTSMAYLAPHLGSTVVKVVLSSLVAISIPVLGVFIAGIFMPWINNLGAWFGLVGGLITSMGLLVEGMLNPGPSIALPLSTNRCSMEDTLNFTNVMETTSHLFSVEINENSSPTKAHSISYLFIGLFGLVVTLIVSLLVSLITGKTNPKTLDPMLFLPVFDNKILPQKVIKFFRFGVPVIKHPDDINEVMCEKKTLHHNSTPSNKDDEMSSEKEGMLST